MHVLIYGLLACIVLLLFFVCFLSLCHTRCFVLHAFVVQDGGWMILLNVLCFYDLLLTIVHICKTSGFNFDFVSLCTPV